MKIYDITQEILSAEVYPGDPAPEVESLCSMEAGDLYNLSKFSMCAHNGTHIDAPLHFIKDGKSVDEIDASYFIGEAFVASHEGIMSKEDAENIVSKACGTNHGFAKRILIKGDSTVTEEAATVFAESGIMLIGVESQSVGPIDAPMATHLILLNRGVVLLEGVRLTDVPEGEYLLSAAPLKIAGIEGSPCRAVLIKM